MAPGGDQRDKNGMHSVARIRFGLEREGVGDWVVVVVPV